MPLQKTLSGKDFVHVLAEYVRKNEQGILEGRLKFTLQPQSLQYLSGKLPPSPYPSSKRNVMREDLFFLLSFFQSLHTLKVSSPGRRMVTDGLLQLSHFANLTTLELNKVHIKVVLGLDILHRQLKRLRCNNSLYNFSDLFVDATKSPTNRSANTVMWPRLTQLDCSHNFADQLDESLRLLSAVKMLDLSFNRITAVDNLQSMSELQYLNLGFNMISSMDKCSSVIGNVTTLVLRNNQLTSVRGIERLMGLEHLDLRENCIWDLRDVRVLSELPFLAHVWLQGNPISYDQVYRVSVLSYFAKQRRNVLLDDQKLTWTEIVLIEASIEQQLEAPRPAEPIVSGGMPTSAAMDTPSRRKRLQRKEAVIVDLDLDGFDDDAASIDERMMAIPASLEAAAANYRDKSLIKRIIEDDEKSVSSHSSETTLSHGPHDESHRSNVQDIRPPIVSPTSPNSLYGFVRYPRSSPRSTPGGFNAVSNATTLAHSPESDEFRHRIETLRREAGTSWLRAYTELQEPTDMKSRLAMRKSTSNNQLATEAQSPVVEKSGIAHDIYSSSLPAPRSHLDKDRWHATRSTAMQKQASHAKSNDFDNVFAFPGRGLEDDSKSSRSSSMNAIPQLTVNSESMSSDVELGKESKANDDEDDEEDNDGEELLLTCKVCQEKISMDHLEEHSRECTLKSQKPIGNDDLSLLFRSSDADGGQVESAVSTSKYRCMLCTRMFTMDTKQKSTNLTCPTCKSTYVVEASTSLSSQSTAPSSSIHTTDKLSSSMSIPIPERRPNHNGASSASVTTSSLLSSVSSLGLLGEDDQTGYRLDEPLLTLNNNLLLYFGLHVFQKESEQLVSLFHTSYLTAKSAREKSVYLVLSTESLYWLIPKHNGVPISSTEPDRTIKVIHSHTLDSLTGIDAGLSEQLLVLHFTHSKLFEPSLYIILLRDSALCSEFVARLMTLVRSTRSMADLLSQDKRAMTLTRILSQVISNNKAVGKAADDATLVKHYALIFFCDPLVPSSRLPMSLIVSADWIYLCEERFLSQAEDLKTNTNSPQFVLRGARPITDVTSIELSGNGPFFARILFEEDLSESASNGITGGDLSRLARWDLAAVSELSRQQVVQSIGEQWAQIFHVNMTITAL